MPSESSCSALVAYGVVTDKIIFVDPCLVREEGFESVRADFCYLTSPTFIYLKETRVVLENDTAVHEVAEPADDDDDDDDDDQTSKTIGAVLTVPCPTKKSCEALRAFVLRHGLVTDEANARPKAQIFFSVG